MMAYNQIITLKSTLMYPTIIIHRYLKQNKTSLSIMLN